MRIALETERLYLRPFEITDAQAMFDGWASDPEVTKFLTWPVHESVDVTKMILEKWDEEYKKPERLNFAIIDKKSQTLIGGIDVVGYLDGDPVIGYNLAHRYWGNGLMSEACKCLLEHLFRLGFKQVHIDANKDNIGSNRVIQKCGGVFIKEEDEELPLKQTTVRVNRYIVYAPRKDK